MKRIYIVRESIVYGRCYILYRTFYKEPAIKRCFLESHEVLEKLSNGDCVINRDGDIVKIKSKDVFTKYDDAVKHLKVVQKKVSAWNKKEEMLIEKAREEKDKKLDKELGHFCQEVENSIKELNKEIEERKKSSFFSVIMMAVIVVAVVVGVVLVKGV